MNVRLFDGKIAKTSWKSELLLEKRRYFNCSVRKRGVLVREDDETRFELKQSHDDASFHFNNRHYSSSRNFYSHLYELLTAVVEKVETKEQRFARYPKKRNDHHR